MSLTTCHYCTCTFPSSQDRCHHCGRPSLFPNVDAASKTEERDALDQRYREAVREASARGALAIILKFEKAMEQSQAALARPFHELQRLATSDNQIYPTYYGLLRGGLQVPEGSTWDVLRTIGDDTVFPGYREQIRFAALTLDETGLNNYGDCTIILRDAMIGHRATAFEENSALWAQRAEVRSNPANVPCGYRSTWQERGRLAIAKLAGKIDTNHQECDFAAILINPGKTSTDDQFIEVHIWGPLTRQAFEKVTIRTGNSQPQSIFEQQILERLQRIGVKVKFV